MQIPEKQNNVDYWNSKFKKGGFFFFYKYFIWKLKDEKNFARVIHKTIYDASISFMESELALTNKEIGVEGIFNQIWDETIYNIIKKK